MSGESLNSDYNLLHNTQLHREHDRVHGNLQTAVDSCWRHLDTDEFLARLMDVADGAYSIDNIRMRKYTRWAHAKSNNRGQMLELRA